MAKRTGLILSISFIGFLLRLSSATNVTDILASYGLPTGLLPDSVASYSLADNGSFVVELIKPCYLHFDYLVYYSKMISGTLQLGSITDLTGIQVQKFFLWLDVQEIKVDVPLSRFIYFQVGFIMKKLDVSQFMRLRSCRATTGPLREISNFLV